MKKNLKITHGALINEDELDNLFDNKNHKTSLAAEYESKLKDMSLEDLKAFAEDLGLLPIDNKNLLVKTIKKELKKK